MKKSFPIDVVLSLTTGFLLKEGGFGDMHELAEHVLGHAVWTHEFVDKELWDRMKQALFAQHPSLRKAENFDTAAAKKDLVPYLTGYVERAVAKFGATLEVERGQGERTESPLASARRVFGDKPIAVITVEDE